MFGLRMELLSYASETSCIGMMYGQDGGVACSLLPLV